MKRARPHSGILDLPGPDRVYARTIKVVAAILVWWLAGCMTDQERSGNSDLPADEHLRDDVAPASGEEETVSPDSHFTPGQTNAGQQVAGLASATGFGEDEDPEVQPDGNNPI